MDNRLELLQSLVEQANQISYHNKQRDAVHKRAEMLLRKIFGNGTHYLDTLKAIRYSPGAWTSNSPDSYFQDAFNRGKAELLNLLNVIIEDIQLDATTNENETISSSSVNLSKRVFIVHGHNEEMKLAVARTIERLKLEPIILHEQPSKGKTIIEKFTDYSDVAFAIVLLSADDIAHSKADEQSTGKYRARQNVIFELGYFIGKLGRERVFALHEVEKNFEMPSDYSGVLFVPFDKAGRWQFDLVRELKSLNMPVDANHIV